MNGDGEPDFVHAAKFKQSNATSSTGDTTTNYYLNLPTSVQVTLSNGNGGHMNPLEYFGAMRPTTVAIGQVIGGANSCLLYTSPSPRDGLLSRMPSSA